MVKSIRGAKGGYRIARYPKNLTLLEILEVMEGPVSIVNCVCHPEIMQRHRGVRRAGNLV